ncbi:c-type cytochrome [Pseudomonas sp. 5P_3.1_Bac2]|uniref:c-type cytochrome n=1 Tax=Pseudomonas sp. 5P_3.1_Bac2 TaxID=2971617 RepID=UPI0021CA91DD|nr:cytochrome c [Pseudomonas sp. 5P_3.1_Bac2]MCU1717011.1 cytochrome c [Pseudomonas sp. 5P_3.1_Bac2]
MGIVRRVCKTLLVLVLIVLAVLLYYVANPNLAEYQPPSQVHYPEQWTDEQRQTYYYTPQGVQVKGLRYNWFTALELPFSQDKFARPEYLARFGFLVDPKQQASALNPGNLPLGFSQHKDPESGKHYLDITCAACHTGELRYKGQAVRIDGGAAMHSLASTVPTVRGGSFGQALGMSMLFTYVNPLKFNRFAHSVLGENYSAKQKKQLRNDFQAVLSRLLGTARNDWWRGLYPTQEGLGRTDAFGRIANTVFGDGIDPSNYHVANAPVSYPHLWDIWKFDWVQWNGSAMQPMARNIGEALGVGATVHLFEDDGKPVNEDDRYASSVRVQELHKLENTLQQLKPPTWPQQLFAPIDLPLASQGRALFTENCAYCHAPHVADPQQSAASGRDPQWLMKIVPTSVIGTDSTAADNIADHRFDLSKLGWNLDELKQLNVQLKDADVNSLDLRSISSAKGLAYITAYVEKRAYADAGISPAQQGQMNGYDLPIAVQEIRGYKARPLDGIWATPPFLHNGSVPTLFQLLSPVAERQSQFWLGDFEFDPKQVGFHSQPFKGGFLFDTRQTGNSNFGHEFRAGCRGNGVIGRALAPAERWALVEYLKVLGNAELEQQLTPVSAKPWNPGPVCQPATQL